MFATKLLFFCLPFQNLHLLPVQQLQGLLLELREGLQAALTELSELRRRDHDLEEKLQAHQTDADDKIMSLKNSLNTFKVLPSRADTHETPIKNPPHTHSIPGGEQQPLQHNLEHLTGTKLIKFSDPERSFFRGLHFLML